MRSHRMPLLLWVLLALAGTGLLQAAPVSPERARTAALQWLALKPYAYGRPVSSLASLKPCADAQGRVALYVAELSPTGFLVLAADDDLEAIVAFSHEGHFGWEQDNPLLGLVKRDLVQRRDLLASLPHAQRTASSAQRAKWARLAPLKTDQVHASQRPPPASVPDAALEDLRVDPFVKSQWNQGYLSRGGANFAVYNYFTPPSFPGDPWNYNAGCVATAIAQVLRFHQHPREGVGAQAYVISVNRIPKYESLLGGDLLGGPYLWQDMVLRPDSSMTDAQCRAIGALLHDVGVVCNMDYSWSTSSALLRIDTLRSAFRYVSAVHGVGFPKLEDYLLALRTNLDAGLPVLMAVRSSNSGHVVVADGYGYSLGTLYHHLNLGWGGIDDTWYNLPSIHTPDGYQQYSVLAECVYNLDPLVAGEIISGRLTDAAGKPVAGVALKAKGPVQASARSNERGLFALRGLSPNASYLITHDGGTRVHGPSSALVSVGRSDDFSPVGNRVLDQFDALASGAAGSLVIERQPESRTLEPGTATVLSVAVSGTGLDYQWYRNGQKLPGATEPELRLKVDSSLDGGDFYCVVTGGTGSLTSRTAQVAVAPQLTPNLQARLVNISSRTLVDTGDQVQTAGFVIEGSSPKQVLIRASGPALLAFGVREAIADPVLTLHDAKAVIAENDNWDASLVHTVAHGLGAFDWPAASRDAALLVTLSPGAYSAVVQDKEGRRGVALVEVYEVDERARNVNISTRSLIGVGDQVQTAGFVINGTGLKTVLIRASGPALSKWLSGTLPDPVLELRDDKGGLIALNDDWAAALVRPVAQRLGAFEWPVDSLDAALLLTLPAGHYNAVVRDANASSGVGLIEVYEVNK